MKMITDHAIERMNSRIKQTGKTVDRVHVSKMCEKYPKGKHYTRIMLLGSWIMTSDGSHGDCVTMVTINGIVKTIMISERDQRWADGAFHSHEQPA